MLHAKTLTIDGRWASIGSVNFDNRSFQLQDEATLCVSVGVVHRRARRRSSSATSRAPRRSSSSAGATRSLRAKANERLLTLARREL